ncbi:PD40 domain-containing protein [Bacillus nakamurai]|uniref:PD40 domain-containing protein n=1 Tax=Bacillus nakamurai TaxID=1793963 RepID=A0A150FCN0_9BACI|nr:PD40 domain-containing protein [Bacillus nakamurai]KXZ22600.1 hypothetical protein AXI58_07410 [Bacillus nakamurai]MED1226393.1 PD40 domain-containing protein [Bacillus nakamurai]
MNKKRLIWIIAAAVAAAAVIAAVLLMKGKSDGGGAAVVSGGHDKLLVSITDTDLLTKYYEDDRVLLEEKLSAYPAFALDDAHQVLYYVGNNDQNEMRLYKLDVKTKQKSTLYKGSASADSLFLSKDLSHIYFRLGKADEDNFRLASFDLKTKRYENLFPAADNKDDSVSNFFYNRKKNSFALLHYSVEEDYKKTDEANEKGTDPEPAKVHVAAGTSGALENLTSLEQFISDVAMSPDGKNLVFTSYTQKGTEQKASIRLMNVKMKKYETIISNEKDFTPLIDAQPQFSKDGSIIYFMAEAKGAKRLKDETGRKAKVRTIYAYHLDTKKCEKVWENDNGIINSFSVIQ